MHVKYRNSAGPTKKRRYRLTVVIAEVIIDEFYSIGGAKKQ